MLYGRCITLVVAATENNIIGADGDMPWRLPADLRRFKRLTTGHAIIMGRRTWESLGRPLPDRQNIVMSRQTSLELEGAAVVNDVSAAVSAVTCEGEVMVIGGGDIYRQFLPAADAIERTVVHTRLEGDTTFPAIDRNAWQLMESISHPADEANEHAMTFERWQRSPDPSEATRLPTA